MIYKTFEEWGNGYFLEDGEPRTEAYTEDELLLIEMGWGYGFDAGAAAMKERCAKVCDDIADESKKLSDEYDRQEDCSYLNQQFGAEECAAAIRALGDDDEIS